MWRQHTEIRQQSAKGHAVCDECELIKAERVKWEGRTDATAKQAMAGLKQRKAAHDADHRGERDYAWDFRQAGGLLPLALPGHTLPLLCTCVSITDVGPLTHPNRVAFYPERVTALNMDAPTERQLDVPTQNRKSFDTCKSLEQKKWETHMMGVLAAGSGMYAYMTRHGLGTGPNLSCTVLYLTLLQLVEDGRPLGAHIHVLLDNTTGDNKNNDVIFFLAWLVETRVCDEASFFCMLVGHTYSEIDRTFNTLIGQLRGVAIWCVSQLLTFTRLFLGAHHVRVVEELHCLWDWKGFFKPHVHTRFSGFATSQFGSGKHSQLAHPPLAFSHQ